MTLNLCSSSGMLGPTRHPVPSDPATFQYWGQHELVLCSHVVCSGCSHPVRWLDGFTIDGGAKVLPAVYRAADPVQVDGVSRGLASSRVYFCACKYYDCGSPVGLFQAEPRPDFQLPTTWGCGGHPPIELPATIGKRSVPGQPDWRSIILEAFRTTPAADAPRIELEWVQHAYGVLGGTPHCATMGAAVGSLLISDEPHVRAHAIHFLWSELDAPETDLLPPMLAEDAETLRSQPDLLWGADLYDTVVGAIAFHINRGRWPYEGAVRDAIRAHLLQPQRVEGAGWLAAERDPEWFIEHLDQLLVASPDSVEKLSRWRKTAAQQLP